MYKYIVHVQLCLVFTKDLELSKMYIYILIECVIVLSFALRYWGDVLSSCSQFGDSVVHSIQ